MISFEFLMTSLVVVATPGTGVLFTVSTGLSQGRAASVHAATGCTLGILPHMLATALGLAAVMHAGAMAFQVLKVAGVLYLLYLAVATWRDRAAFAVNEHAAPLNPWKLGIKAVLLNTLNPKLTLFFLAFLPQFMDPTAPSPMVNFAVLSAVFMGMTWVVFVGYGLLAHAFRQAVLGSTTLQNGLRRGFAAAFAAMAAKLALTKP